MPVTISPKLNSIIITVLYKGRHAALMGGLMMYIPEKLNYKVKTYGNQCNNWESQIVELSGGGLSKQSLYATFTVRLLT